MTTDIVAHTNHFLSQLNKPILRWVECEECDGTGGGTRQVGEQRNPGMGPTWMPIEVDWTCGCDEGYVQVDEGDSRWDAGTLAHPND